MLATTTVAPADERVVGLVVTAADEVEPLHVAARHRGTGIAGALLQHGERVIAGEHCRAFLAVVDGNAPARRFSTCHGWDDAGSFDHRAWSSTGERVAVPCRRYEKACPAPLAGMRRQAVVAERESDDRCGREPGPSGTHHLERDGVLDSDEQAHVGRCTSQERIGIGRSGEVVEVGAVACQ